MKYFLNGQEITAREAHGAILQEIRNAQSCDVEEFEAIWNNHYDSEEARDLLFDLSDCTVEFTYERGDSRAR